MKLSLEDVNAAHVGCEMSRCVLRWVCKGIHSTRQKGALVYVCVCVCVYVQCLLVLLQISVKELIYQGQISGQPFELF